MKPEIKVNESQELAIEPSESPRPALESVSHLPWTPVSEQILVADPPRYRVAIRAANGYRVVVEDEPSRWEQAQKDYEFICVAVNDPRWLFGGYIKRLENAFLMVYDLAGIDATPLPEALPESAYVPGYIDKVRELREVFAIATANMPERETETDQPEL